MVDEPHAWGDRARGFGSVDHAEIDGVVEIWMGMLSNASSRVAAVAGREDLIDYRVSYSRLA